ncbi:ester cyclase [Pseudaestuariivita atlantica]|uniref:Polyketide cyclase n=1 Tax=Pseudaestuariivita atlantica TaxID=1317121 RepID=A0A0L1JM72_9RHOB|nr:ester cyclase [Pseudaestuariivita atlantica]KNG92855.1 polyketide cyclase [Pseudaestuariivita atlantica]
MSAAAHKAALQPFRAALAQGDPAAAREAFIAACAPDVLGRFCHPFGDLTGAEAIWEKTFAPLGTAWPDLERRDWIVIAGEDEDGASWVGCGGTYVGLFDVPWLGIPPTGHLAHMRLHEFYRFDDGKIIEIQALWDIPEVMLQARTWPMAPSLGREWNVPGPATCDGLGPHDADLSDTSRSHVIDMLTAMSRHPAEPPDAMEMPRFWHTDMSWYGPAGIGTARGIDGFRNHHQRPFLAAMPDRGQHADETRHHFIAEGAYVGVTGWPNMAQTLTGGGWLGLPGTGQKVTLRSLDFWRMERGKIRENWVLVDLLHLYHQLGIDVFHRMRELLGESR